MQFFIDNFRDLKEMFHIERITDAIEDTLDDAEQLERLILDIPFTDNLDELFKPLGTIDMSVRELTREKARNWDRKGHASWLRVCYPLGRECVCDYRRGNQTYTNYAGTSAYPRTA